MTHETYKEINIKTNNPLTVREKQALISLNSLFCGNGFDIKFSKMKINIFLKEIDYKMFKEQVGKIDNEFNTKILRAILNNIDSIKSYGIRGNKRNYIDYNKERKVKNRRQKEKKRGQYFYAKNNNFSTKNNTLPEKYVDKIICGNSKEILKKFPENSIDLIFTSPPYNFGLDYTSNHDDAFWVNYFNDLFAIFDESIRVLKYGGRIIVNIQPLFSDYIPSHHIVSNYFMKKKLIWKGEILWEKNNYNCKYTAWGSWKSPSNPYLKYTWEFLEIFSKGILKKEGKTENIDINAAQFKQWVTAKWVIAPERNMKKWKHPAMFPEKLVERVLKLFSFKNDIILDPFNGAGTTTIAKKLERHYIGIDVSNEYCGVAKNRIKHAIIENELF